MLEMALIEGSRRNVENAIIVVVVVLLKFVGDVISPKRRALLPRIATGYGLHYSLGSFDTLHGNPSVEAR